MKKLLLLERKLGRNPIDLFFDMDAGRLPKLGDIMTVLQCAMDGVTDAQVVRLYEDWLADCHYGLLEEKECRWLYSQEKGFVESSRQVSLKDMANERIAEFSAALKKYII